MNADDRRTFLTKLAKGAAYLAPAVVSFAAPVHLVGQGMPPPTMMMMVVGGSMGIGMGMADIAAPWNAPPPGRMR